MDDFDDFLGTLDQKGQLDSEGQITLNVLKARKKLGSHQLARPQDFLLPFLAVGTLSGATIVDYVGDYDKLRIDFDGQPLNLNDLEQCLGQTTGRGAELALGLRAAGGRGAKRLIVASVSDETVNILGFTEDVPNLRQVSAKEFHLPYVTRVQIQGTKVPSGEKSVRDFLIQNASHSPIVAHNGRRLIPSGLVSTPGSLTLNTPGGSNPSPSMMSWVKVEAEHEHCSGRVWMTGQSQGSVTLVRHGVSYPADISFHPYPGLSAVLSSPEVKLDISRSGVVIDQTIQDLVRSLLETLEQRLMPRILREYRSMMPRGKEVAQPFLRRWAGRADAQSAARIKRLLG